MDADQSLIKLVSSDLASLPRPAKFDESLFGRFYSIDDFDSELILVHGQRGFGVVNRSDGQLVREVDDLDDLFTQAENERDVEYKAANQRHEMHALFEYLNLKLYKDFVVLATWSKLCVFDASTLCLYAKVDLFSLGARNCWYLPQRMFVSKHGQLVFYDSNNLLLTFI